MKLHELRPVGHRPLTNPDAPHDAGRNTPAARAYRNDRRDGKVEPSLSATDPDAAKLAAKVVARGLPGLLDAARARRFRGARR